MKRLAGRSVPRRLTRFFFGLGVVSGLTLGLSGCGPPREKPTLVLDSQGTSAVELYDLGVSQLLLGNLDKAEEAFRSCLAVARRSGLDFAPPHEGMARVLLRRNELDKAEAEAMHAQELDKYWSPVYWVLGKIEERQKNDEPALAYYERGLVVEPENEELLAAATDLLNRTGRSREAAELAARAGKRPPARDSGGADARKDAAPKDGQSSLEKETLAKLDPFFPDDQSLLTPPVLAIFQQPNLTRGALAVLITGDGDHGLAGALNRSGITEGKLTPPSDASHRPEEAWIDRALAMGVLEAFPDGTFKPDQTITRMTLSLWVEETIARLRNDRRVFELYRGQKSPFTDIPDGHYGLNAARIVVDLGLMKPRSPGVFAPNDPVSTDEGLALVRRLGPALLGETK